MGKVLSKYDIHIHGLEEKSYEYDFEGSDEFFREFEQDLIESGSFRVAVLLDKTISTIRLTIHITGTIKLICDRSLEEFDEPLSITEKYIYKYGDRREVISDEIEIIPFGTPKINISQHIFDFISLSVPMKKLHPRFRNETGNEEEDGILIYSDQSEVQDEEKNQQEESTDPRWAALLKLKNKE